MEDDHYHVDEERPALPSFPSHASFRRRNPLVDEHGLPVRPILAPSQRGNGVYHRLQRRPFELDPIQNPCGVLAHALMLCLSTNKNRSDACAVHERKMNECNARFRVLNTQHTHRTTTTHTTQHTTTIHNTTHDTTQHTQHNTTQHIQHNTTLCPAKRQL
eukprot:TRINITY_DN4217_c1_g1_i2.p1 TRINITY_DN4217_c1_g1~~TRINITY_DN4217_c1_g1_i2.p1  ORF type:complete len:180 (+),score=30.85 TRINITY_DN4217_c1_g1_i2:61-540(+)